MANVLNRTTKQYLTSVNTPDYPIGSWIHNPDLSLVIGWPNRYWTITGDVVTLQPLPDREATDDQEFDDAVASTDGRPELFGDGNDNGMIISTDTTLTRDLYPKKLTINSGVTLTTNGFRIVAKKGIVINGIISNNGQNATLLVAGVGGLKNTLGGGGAGALGSLTIGANSASLNTDANPGQGGRGGNGGAGTSVGGTSGNIRTQPNSRVRSRRFDTVVTGTDFDENAANKIVRFQGGTGGAGGGGDGAFEGGNGGGGGGLIVLVAPYILIGLGATIECKGGSGSNGEGGNTGGGGGGGGGLIMTASAFFRERGARTVTGGTGGAGVGTGTAGANGGDGRSIHLSLDGS